ncbi:MAG: GFA family protein [Rhizobium sp.]|nr:GFA family protein [Rhizobium sp.]
MADIGGSCLCGGISYRISGDLRPVVACHCNQCRKASGHYVAATQALARDIEIEGDPRWYRSSDFAERGFCATCGSNLFWRKHGGAYVSIFAGGLDGPTGLKMVSQLHCESSGDYYELPDLECIDQATLK